MKSFRSMTNDELNNLIIKIIKKHKNEPIEFGDILRVGDYGCRIGLSIKLYQYYTNSVLVMDSKGFGKNNWNNELKELIDFYSVVEKL